MNEIRIGMIGLDTSHATAFTKLLNDSSHPYHVAGGRVTIAYRGGSPDFPLSMDRVDKYANEMRQQYGVQIVDTLEEVAAGSDAILLESVDGRVHLEQFKAIAPYGKPVFIDKPLALSSAAAEEIVQIAAKHHIPLMSSSSLRYADALCAELDREGAGGIIGADVYGPMEIQSTQSHYFWYGIHAAEMLFALMGPGCEQVAVISTDAHELITGRWSDGRIGTARGNRSGNYSFGALVHRKEGSACVDINSAARPYYASLVEQVMLLFTTGQPPLDSEETLEIIRFLEAAEESRAKGTTVQLITSKHLL
ncbi:Gfo/Idh/MocA family protein [Paenibacillus sp. sgz302251]|uniref:Gfo/Idh/MocA family protein n=1 Tax=Paenibacillus sp. sgz302251 TaxID=3414493 RepID=UPI003C7D2921